MTDWKRYVSDRAAFRREMITLPNGKLYGDCEEQWQRERIWAPWDSGDYNLLYYEASRGLAKTAAAAMMALEMMLFTDRLEAHAFASDGDQAAILQGMVAGMIEANPALESSFNVNRMEITCPATRSTLTIETSDAPSSYGLGGRGRALLMILDEAWTLTGDSGEQLWSSIISATGKVGDAWRVVILSNAGIEGVSQVAWRVREEARKNPKHYFWRSDGPIAGWITPEWIELQRGLLLPNAFTRLIENVWTSPDSTAIQASEWDAIVKPELTMYPADFREAVFVALDASKSARAGADTTAAVVIGADRRRRPFLVAHRIWTPSGKGGDVDYLATVLPFLVDIKKRYRGVTCFYDPYNLSLLAQIARKHGIRMVEYPQNTANLSLAASAMLDNVRGERFSAYHAPDLREHVLNAVLIESVRGVRLAKEKSTRKVDGAVALAMALAKFDERPPSAAADSIRLGDEADMERIRANRALDEDLPVTWKGAGGPPPERPPEEPLTHRIRLTRGYHNASDQWQRTFNWPEAGAVNMVGLTLARQLLDPSMNGKFELAEVRDAAVAAKE